MRRWADGLELEAGEERVVAELDGDAVAWAGVIPPDGSRIDPNAVGFYENLGARRLRQHVSEWGRLVPWMGIDL